MKNKFTSRIKKGIAFGVETTGLSPKDERIIELAYIIINDGIVTDEKVLRFNPEKPIPAGAKSIHGISDEDVKDAPKFSEMAEELRESFSDDMTFIGYNVDFDLKFLREEFKRAKTKPFSWSQSTILDPMELWNNEAPRHRLVDAHKVFIGSELQNAHSALADITATIDVLDVMVDRWFSKDTDEKAVASACFPDASTKKKDKNAVDDAGKFVWDKDGEVSFNFGKHIGKKLKDTNKGYLSWMINQDFAIGTKDLLKKAIDGKPLPKREKDAK